MYFKIARVQLNRNMKLNANPYHIDLEEKTYLSPLTFTTSKGVEAFLNESNVESVCIFWKEDDGGIDETVDCIYNANKCHVVRVTSIEHDSLVYRYYGLFSFTDDQDI